MAEKTAKGRALARGERLQIMLDGDELVAVDDFRFSHRMPTRAAAVRELLKRGLAAEGFKVGKVGTRFQSYGVIERSGADGRRSGDSIE